MGLIEESKNITLEEFNSRLTKLSAETLDSIEALRSAAYNDVIKELNRDEYAIPLSNWQRLISWLA